MQKFVTVIIDDEPRARDHLRSLIEKFCPELEVSVEFGNAKEAIAHLSTEKPDVVFLDIRMPGMSGLGLLENLNDSDIRVIIFSAYDSYGIPALKNGAFDYILKPATVQELRKVVARLEQARNSKQDIPKLDRVIVPMESGFKVVELSDIICISSDNTYSTLHLVDRRNEVVTKSIKEFETSLKNQDFYRIHNRSLINLKHMISYSSSNGGTVIMSDGTEVLVSRRKQKEFKELVRLRFESLP